MLPFGPSAQPTRHFTAIESGRFPWFGVRVHTRSEFRTHEELTRRGFESFLPLHLVRRRWSDRVKTVEYPLFPGYLFCRFELSRRHLVLTSPGVAHIVGAGSTPIPIEETEVRSIQTLVSSKVALIPWPCYHVGQRVRIDYGPLRGVEGTVAQTDDGSCRIVVTVELFERAVAAEIDRDWIGRALNEVAHQVRPVRVAPTSETGAKTGFRA